MKQPRSITEHIYQQLRADLISCKLKPGSRLGTSELSKRFSVSLSGVREALSRLVSEKLVIADPQRGFQAAPMSSEDLYLLTETATGIEAICIRSALVHGNKDWEKRLISARDAVLKAPVSAAKEPNRISKAFTRAHHAFHETLISACNNSRTLDLRRLHQDHSERYRQLCIPYAPNNSLKIGYEEITIAATARDADTTIKLVSEQFRRNVDRFAEALDGEESVRFWINEVPGEAPASVIG